MVDVDEAKRASSIDRLAQLGGLSDERATEVVDAVVGGAIDHAFELLDGSSAVPTSMTAARADQLRFVCDRAGRMLSQRETELIFRVTSTTARSVLNTMLATYEEALRAKFLVRMREDATVVPTGTQEDGLEWEIRFTESSTIDLAWTELRRLGLLADAERNSAQRSIRIPRTIEHDGDEVQPLELLGLAAP